MVRPNRNVAVLRLAVASLLCWPSRGQWLSGLLAAADDDGASLLRHAAALVPGGDSALSPDAILFSPAGLGGAHRQWFFDTHWEESWVHLPGSERTGAGLRTHAETLGLNATTLRAVIGAMDAPTAKLHVKTAQRSGPTSCKADGAACVRGALVRNDTLVFDGGEYLLPAIHSLVDSWKRSWGVYVGANFYLTPAETQVCINIHQV